MCSLVDISDEQVDLTIFLIFNRNKSNLYFFSVSTISDVWGTPICPLYIDHVWYPSISDMVRRNRYRIIEKGRNKMGKKIKMEVHSGSVRPIQYLLVFTIYSSTIARKKLWIFVLCLNGFPAFSLKNVIKRLYFCVVLTFEWWMLLWSGVTVLNGSFYFIVRNWFLIFFLPKATPHSCVNLTINWKIN